MLKQTDKAYDIKGAAPSML